MEETEKFVLFLKEKFSKKEINLARYVFTTQLLTYSMINETIMENGKEVTKPTNVLDLSYLKLCAKNFDDSENLLEKIYPIGSVYISENETNPSEFLGGEWENYGQGRTLIGAGEGNDGNIAKTFANKETGGEYNHTLTIAEMPSHTHIQNPHTHPIRFDGREDLYIGLYAGDVNSPPGVHTNWTGGTRTYTAIAESVTATNQNTGESQPHNNIQPYITVHMWKRIS